MNIPAKGRVSIHVGTCAWSFDEWRGLFYPEHLAHGDWLGFYARHFPAVEIDSTFYGAPAPSVVEHWSEVTSHDFMFAAKLPRAITHERGLRDCAPELEAFLHSITHLHEKLACLLVQLPPYFSPGRDEHTLRDFVRRLPRSPRFAIEFRDRDWHHPRIAHLLEEHGVCWVWNDVSDLEHANEAPFGPWPQTTDFLYLRLLGHLDPGEHHPEGGSVSRAHHVASLREAAVDSWVEKVRVTLPRVKRALVFAGNHFEGFAPRTALRIAEKIGVTARLPTADELDAGATRQLPLL